MDQPPRAPNQPAPPAQPSPGPVAPPDGAPVSPRRSRRISIPGIVIGLAMIGSIVFIGYVVLRVEDNQIPLMAAGFVVLGASLAAIALWCVAGIWRAASRARGGRALGLAIIGGLAGMAAIGCFAIAALSTLVWNS
jgi:hypothetical protein